MSRTQNNLNRPATDEVLTAAILYTFMTEAQSEAVEILAAHVPQALLGDPVALTAVSGNKTFTFGTDTGLPTSYQNKYPLGHAEIYATRASIPDSPLVEGEDYLLEGDVIRIPNFQARTFADGGPWARFISPPGVIDAATQPTLVPPFARTLIVAGTCIRGCRRMEKDAGVWERYWDRELAKILLALKTQVWTQGGRARTGRSGMWWRSGDLG